MFSRNKTILRQTIFYMKFKAVFFQSIPDAKAMKKN